MIRFFAPDIVTSGLLPEVESGHCCRVLRLKTGDRIEVVDGRGGVYSCIIKDPDPRHTSVEIESSAVESRHWNPRVTLAVAPTKNIDRMEWLAEKAVEIGVDRMVFLNCRRGIRKIVKRERIEKIIISAMKQSLKARLPEFTEMMEFSRFVSSDRSECRYMGYCDDAMPRREFALDYDGRRDVTVMIGPEGDFDPEEVEAAVRAGYAPVTFGETRLRTETAALYALVAAHTLMTKSEKSNIR